VNRRALLSTVAVTSASVGLAGCGSLLGCRGVSFELALGPISEDETLQLTVVRAQTTGETGVDAVDGPVRDDDYLAERLGTRSVVWSHLDAAYYRVEYEEEEGTAAVYTSRRLDGAAAAREAGTAQLDAVADAPDARELLKRATDEEVEWCTRDEGADAYQPVVEAVARKSGYGQQVYSLNDETVVAPARWNDGYYRAELWADTAE
jgi:hypothetical protein